MTGYSWRNPVHVLAFGFGTGLSPKAPGTAGSLVGIPLHLLTVDLPLPVRLGIVVALALAGVWICGRAASDLGVEDHPGIVWDEIVGMLITLLAAPAGWPWLVAGFVLFRVFDVAKPWPVGAADRHVHGGLGIMLDDLLAGLLAAGALWLSASAWHALA